MRKLIISIILAVLIYLTYDMVIGGSGDFNSVNYEKLKQEKSILDLAEKTLAIKNTQEYAEKKNLLSQSVTLYNQKKSEYEDLLSEQQSVAYDSTDLYDIDFLWTQIGNYATNNGIVLKFDVLEADAGITESTDYTVCDLDFSIVGSYISVTEFIYDIEDDDRFEFEICEFAMLRPEKSEITELFPDGTPEEVLDKIVKTTFKIKNIPINASTLSEVASSAVDSATNEIQNAVEGGVTSAVQQQQ